jgi:hypothetical protein
MFVIRCYDRDNGITGIVGFQWSTGHNAYITKTWYHTEREAQDAACEMCEESERFNTNRVYLVERAPTEMRGEDFNCI